MKKPLTIFQKILLTLIVVMLIIMLSDLLLQYLFDISLSCGVLIIPLAVVGMISLYVFFPRKKLFALVLFCIISGFVLIFYNITKDGLGGSRRSIGGSRYSIEVTPRKYSIIRYYDFAEKIVATKYSDVFFDRNSKRGFDLGYQVKVVRETQDSLYIEINSRLHTIDSLKKRSLWDKR